MSWTDQSLSWESLAALRVPMIFWYTLSCNGPSVGLPRKLKNLLMPLFLAPAISRVKLAKFSAKLVANFRRSLEGVFWASFAGENRQKHFPPKLHRRFHHQTSLRGSGLWRALLFLNGTGQMGSYVNGVGWILTDFNRILTGFYLSGPARVRPGPSKTHDFKGFLPDLSRIPWNLVKIWLKTAWPPPRPTPFTQRETAH